MIAGSEAAIRHFDAIAFDGDDTLWHNETIFADTEEWFRALARRYVSEAPVDERLLARERANLSTFGYGIKGFVLSMIETIIEITEERVLAADIQAIIDRGRVMLAHPVELLPGARETLVTLAGRYRLMLITKGDLLDQESKIARSGLVELFDQVDILSEKDPATYARVLARAGIKPKRFLMVGNSLRSDVLPVAAMGGSAVYIPYQLTWAHEVLDEAALPDRVYELPSLQELPAWLHRLSAENGAGAAEG